MKTNPSISISFPQSERDAYLDKRDKMVQAFIREVGVSSFSEIVRMVLNGQLQEVDGHTSWVVKIKA